MPKVKKEYFSYVIAADGNELSKLPEVLRFSWYHEIHRWPWCITVIGSGSLTQGGDARQED